MFGEKLHGAKPDICPACVEAKLTQSSFSTRPNSRESSAVNDLVHSDVVGPMSQSSFGGKRWVVFCIDDFSRFVSPYYLEKKSD